MKHIKENWKFLLFIIIVGIIASYFTTIYTLDMVPEEEMSKAIEQVGSREMVIAISALQSIVYVVLFGIFGIILSNKVGLWKKINIKKKELGITSLIALIGGISLIVFDVCVFGRFNDIIKQSYETKPSWIYIMASFTYGGVVEEVMMRLFLMSLLSLIIYKIFYKKEKEIPIKVYVIANVISAILFAAGHFPSTIQAFGYLDGLLIFRSLLLNGGAGLAFGWLYRKYGIHYAMLAHFGCHLVSKVIWFFIV